MLGFSVPSVCGTYIKTLTSNKAFIEELVANKAFIDELAAKVITLQNGGIIKSDNYSPSSIKTNDDGTQEIDTSNYSDTGWAIDSRGNADFTNMHAVNMTANGGTFTDITAEGGTFTDITAEGGTFTDVNVSGTINATSGILTNITIKDRSTFNGDIISGPLILTSENPSGNTTTLPAGKWLGSEYSGTITGVKGTYNNISFYTAVFTIPYLRKSSPKVYGGRLQLYNQAGNLLYDDDNGSFHKSDAAYKLNTDFVYQNIYNENTKTFKLLNLPTSEPSETGVVWNDNGILKIKS